MQLPFIKISAPEIISGTSGESEAKLRDLFDEAAQSAPCILFIDEIDAITPKRASVQREMERRIVSQLLTCMDELALLKGKLVMVIGATNRPDAIDTALRRGGRFEKEIAIGIPDEYGRKRILEVLIRGMRVKELDTYELGRRSAGFVGADLVALTKEAATTAINRIFEELYKASAPQDKSVMGLNDKRSQQEKVLQMRRSISDGLRNRANPLTEEELSKLFITMADFVEAVSKVQPSSKRAG